MQSLIVSTLAEYQTQFWLPVGRALEEAGCTLTFVSYDTRSTQMLEDAGLDVMDATLSARMEAVREADPMAICRAFGVHNPGPWLTHEKFAFGARDTDFLLRKFAGSLLIGERAIRRARGKGEAILVQELGGFLSVLGLHFAALNAHMESLFIEPSFFTGRMAFVANQLAAFRPGSGVKGPVTQPLLDYFDEALASGTVVIPAKDRHHYASAATKIFNPQNIRRLVEKSRDKFLGGAEQEFGAIGHHVRTHLSMLRASVALRGAYTPLGDMGAFLYFPLHVPGDVALTLRSPEYLDQLALLDYMCRIVPPWLTIATKEHPAMIGAIGSEGLLALKRRYDNFAILPPSTNNYAVLRQAEVIATINSKSGAEAGLLGRNVITLGDAFYRDAPFAIALDGLDGLGAEIEAEAGANPRPAPDAAQTRAFFAGLWQCSYRGELYLDTAENVTEFTTSLLRALEDRLPLAEPAEEAIPGIPLAAAMA